MTVAVAAGVVQVAGVLVSVAGGNLTVGAADATDARYDLAVVDDAGVKSIAAGTPSANPVFPTHPVDSVVLAAIYVPANDTDIDAGQIVSKAAGTSFLPHTFELPLSTWGVDGLLAVAQGTHGFTAEFAFTLTRTRARAGTVPTGAGVRVDINRNGSSVFASTGDQPTIADGQASAISSTYQNAAVAAGDVLTMDVDTVGTTYTGSNLVVTQWAKRAV